MKNFIITIDTEGDNLWEWKQGNVIKTENAAFLPRFQNLCDTFGFKPVWLSNYEMMTDPRYVDFIMSVEEGKRGELGMHLHAWSTPPYYELPCERNGAPYLIEYPTEVMEAKVAAMTDVIREKTGLTPISHRAGRWAMDARYFSLLEKYGYKVDCSVTPHMDWRNHCGQTAGSGGSDYRESAEMPHRIQSVWEVPVSIRMSHRVFPAQKYTPRALAAAVYHAVEGTPIWMRPNGKNLAQMLWLVDRVADSDGDYIMFMLHSSEMMPGGSPSFRTEKDIEDLYRDLTVLFRKVTEKGFRGITLREYAAEKGIL